MDLHWKNRAGVSLQAPASNIRAWPMIVWNLLNCGNSAIRYWGQQMRDNLWWMNTIALHPPLWSISISRKTRTAYMNQFIRQFKDALPWFVKKNTVKQLNYIGIWPTVQIELLAARTFLLFGETIYFYDFQMNPLTRNNLIVRGEYSSPREPGIRWNGNRDSGRTGTAVPVKWKPVISAPIM